jgi:Tfp pilus assembly protein PilX
MRKLTETWKNKRERGVALIFAIFTLLLISAIAASLVFMSNTETSVNSNYRAERVSSFGAKSGMEEVRDRMGRPTTDPNSLLNLLPGVLAGNPLPGVFPPAPNSVLYVVNEGTAPGTVQPWVAGNAYMDDELCHDFAGVQAGQQPASDVRCSTPPTAAMLVAGENAGAPITSTYPWAGTRAALTYKWVRLTLKQSGSNQNYPVNGGSLATQVCWNGSNEMLVNAPDLICQDNIDPTSLTVPPAIKSATPVYQITALAVSATGTTRKMVQAEVAQTPAQPFNYGLYATSTACPALTFGGGGNSNPATDSYNSKNGAYGGQNKFDTGGSVGAIGGVLLNGHSQIGGNVGVQSLPGAGAQFPCPGGDYTTVGTAGIYNPNGNGGNPNPNVLVQLSQPPPSFPTPPDPSPMPTASSPQPGNPAVPGTYGAISTNGVLTLAPGVYNIYSLRVGGGNGAITVNPPGTVVLNFPSTNTGTVIDIAGQGIVNPGVPNAFQINYPGTGSVLIRGQGSEAAVVDAPNSNLTVAGNGDFFGRLIGGTINYGGNGKFHYDTATMLRPTNNSAFQLISYREITY